jgi:hypothetical protein
MSDEEYFQGHKDDTDEWGEPEPPAGPNEKRRLAAMVSVRLSPGESDAIRKVAAARQMTLSGFMRQAALAEAGLLPRSAGLGARARVETRTTNLSEQPGAARWTLRESVTAVA